MIQFKLVDLARLQGQLNQANVVSQDRPLYQVVSQLISAVKQVQDTVNFNISTFSAGLNVSAGTSSRVVTQLIFSNQNSVSFGLSNNTITASANPGILFSAGSISSRYTGLTFSNSNNVNFGNAAGVVTASAYVHFSAGGNFNNLSDVVFSNSNGVSFGLSGSTITASISAGQQSINFSAGTTSNNLSNVVFSNANGVTFGLNGSTITGSVVAAAGGATLSYWENVPLIFNTNASGVAGNATTIQVQPFSVGINISGDFLRAFWSNNVQDGGGYGTTSANTTWSAGQSWTRAYVIYTKGIGASSLSLQSIYSNSYSSAIQTVVGASTAGSRYTVTYNITYPFQNTTGNFSSSFAASQANYFNSSIHISQFQGGVFADYPFGTSLTPGNYYIGFGGSSSSDNNGAPGGISAATLGYSTIIMSQSLVFRIPATTQTEFLQPFLGVANLTGNSLSRASIAYSDMSSRASNALYPFQIISKT